MDDFLKKLGEDREEFLKKCAEERNSKRYQDATKHLNKIIFEGYIPVVTVVSFYALRDKDYYDQFLSIRLIDTFLESIAAVVLLIDEGCINQAKRELRFLLEAALKFWYVDQVLIKESFEKRLEMYNELVPNSSLSFLSDLNIHALADDAEFRAIANGIYRDLCKFVHASKTQNLNRLLKSSKGEHLGFTSAKEIESMCSLCLRVLDIALACHFSVCGQASTGDIFVADLDKRPDWVFHKTRFVSQISKTFNYKSERQSEGN